LAKHKKKSLVIGSEGMLGIDVVTQLSFSGYEVMGWDLDDIDIVIIDQMSKISDVKPDIIINCAAYTAVDLAETEREKCYSVNVEGVKNLVDYCKNYDVPLVHFSTDYVFDGLKKGYSEDDVKNPINYYGKTKSLGEDIIINELNKFYLIRTSWLFGENGKNFVDTISKLSSEKDKLDVVSDQHGSPTYTFDLSRSLVDIIKNKDFGVYHRSNDGECSWFEFAKEIVRLNDNACFIKPCSSDKYPGDAKRPTCGVLSSYKLEPMRHWKEALKDYVLG